MANKPPISTLSFAALRTHVFPPEHYIIGDGILAKNGMLFIAGPPKSYKSFVNYTLAYNLITGTNLFRTYKMQGRAAQDIFLVPKPQRVLILEQEIGFYDVRERLMPMYSSLSDEHKALIDANLFIHSRDHTMQLDSKDGTKRIAEIIEAIRPDVVMFDPLIEFHSSNENDSQHMNLVMHNLSLLQENYEFAMVITHHTGKPDASGSKTGLDLMRGSSVLAGKLDTVMLLKVRNRNAGLVKVEFVVRRGKPINDMVIKLDWNTLMAEFQTWDGPGKKRTVEDLLSDQSPIN